METVKRLTLICLLVCLWSCEKEDAKQALKSQTAPGDKSQLLPVDEVAGPTELINGTYRSTCVNLGFDRSEGYTMYVQDEALSVLYQSFWRADCDSGTESDNFFNRLDRETHEFIETRYMSRWDDYYMDKCGVAGESGDAAEADNCYLSWKGEDIVFYELDGGAYEVLGIEFFPDF